MWEDESRHRAKIVLGMRLEGTEEELVRRERGGRRGCDTIDE